MKKHYILNRPMFNRGGVSAYGRGIASNLVTEEQRQRFNYGGRVGAWDGMSIGNILDQHPSISRRGSNYGYGTVPETISQEDLYSIYRGGNYGSRNIMDQMVEEEVGSDDDVIERSVGDIFYEQQEKSAARKTEADALGVSVSELDAIERDQRSEQTQREMAKEELFENFKENEDLPPPHELKADPKSDVIDWETFAEGLYDKKGAKGKAQLELAGNVLAAAFQPKKEAMAILGKGLGDFGKTATQRKKKMEDIAATGKMYDKIYKTRATEKGKQDRLTAEAKAAAAKSKTDIGKTFWSAMAGTGGNKDKDIANNLRAASEGKIDFKEVDEETFKKMMQDPAAYHTDQIVFEGDIMVVDKNKPVNQWSVKAQIFAGI